MTIRFLRALGLVAVTLVAACVEDESAPSVAEANNIIFVTPNTGEYAAKGAEYAKAIQMAFERIDAARGASNRPLLLHPVDAGDNAESCKPRLEAKIQELGVANVRGIITASTGAQVCAIPFALDPTSPLQVRVPVIESSSGSDLMELGPKNPDGSLKRLDAQWAFATRPLCGPEPRFSADYVQHQYEQDPTNYGRIMMLRGPQAHDKGHLKDFRKHLTALGYKGVFLGDANGAEIEMDTAAAFEPHIEAAIAQNASAIYYHVNGDLSNLRFFSAAKRAGFKGLILTCGMARSTKLLDPVTSENTTAYLAGIDPPMPGGRLHFMMRGPIASPALDAFRDEFRTAAKQQNVDAFTPSTYDAAMLLGLSLTAADGDPNKAREILLGLGQGGKKFGYADAFGVLAALRNGEDVDLDGTASTLDFIDDPVNGALVSGRYYGEIIKETGGKYVYEIPAGTPIEELKPEPLNPPATE